ncbi:folylpolyglutamate synthase/dihydrofolate synthase family protein [soil metagenome]
MNFAESIEYLYNLGYELSVKKFGLENTTKLLKALENPERNYLKIQVAGTNGKGSTVAFLESICVAAKIKVGKFTSPHLVSITERICINSAEISENKFAKHATRIREVSEKLVSDGELEALPTFFEHVTAIALCAFAEEDVEIAILETGLGGRFDATTATNAEIVAITPIDYDHQNILGNSLTEIASEKAAIIRWDTRVLSVLQQTEAEKVIYGKCREVGVEPIWTVCDVKLLEDLGGFYYLGFKTETKNYKTLLMMKGKHQQTNANLAIYIAETLLDFGYKISKQDIEIGLEMTEHSGRLEFYKNFLFDGAHNASGAKALREYLDDNIKKPIIMIFGAMMEKDLSEISEILFPKAEKLIFTKPDNPRSMEVSELTKFAPQNLAKENLFLTPNVADALKTAQEISGKDDLILVTGSLYLIGEIKKHLKKSKSEI